MTTFAQNNPSMESTLGGTQLGVPNRVGGFLRAWQQRRTVAADRRRAAAADQQFWNAALADPRIMAEIARARGDHPEEVRTHRMMRDF